MRELPHRKGPIVVKVGGAALSEPAQATAMAQAIAALHRSGEEGVVVIHGGGAEIDQHLARLGMTSVKRDGIRITPADQIDEIVAVLAGKINKRFVGQLQAQGIPAVGLCLSDGFLLRTEKATQYALDAGRVGRAAGGDPRLVEVLLRNGFVPVLCSIGLDAAGFPLNINADEAAGDIARLLKASSLMLLTDVPGVLDANGALLPVLSPDQVEQRLASGAISGGMVPKVRSALATAIDTNVPVVIASWRDVATLQNRSNGSGCGTRILPNESSPSHCMENKHGPTQLLQTVALR